MASPWRESGGSTVADAAGRPVMWALAHEAVDEEEQQQEEEEQEQEQEGVVV